MGCLLGWFAFRQGVALFNHQWRGVALFQVDMGGVDGIPELRQHFGKTRVMAMRVNIAEGHEYGVTGVIVAAVECYQLFVAEGWNRLGFAAGVVVVSGGGEQVFAKFLPQDRNGRTHRAFHFVVDHAANFEG